MDETRRLTLTQTLVTVRGMGFWKQWRTALVDASIDWPLLAIIGILAMLTARAFNVDLSGLYR